LESKRCAPMILCFTILMKDVKRSLSMVFQEFRCPLNARRVPDKRSFVSNPVDTGRTDSISHNQIYRLSFIKLVIICV
jgi:hypothetical protein